MTRGTCAKCRRPIYWAWQVDRWLHENPNVRNHRAAPVPAPGSSTWEASMDLHIANITARMSDLRKAGVTFVHWTDDSGTDRYRIQTVTAGEQPPLWEVA